MSTNSKISILGTVSEISALSSNRTSAGIILEVDNNQIVIDPGIGTITQSSQSNIELDKTTLILVSNTNISYCNDINAIIEHADKNIHLICSKELLKHDDSILTLSHAKSLKIISLDKDEIKQTNIKNLDIEAQYNKSDAISYKITTSKYILGYISQAKYSKQFVESFKDSNILIINFATITHEKNSKYLDMEEITELIREINPELVILNGFSKKIIESDPLDLSRKIKKELQKDKTKLMQTQILPAKELMIINPDTYNIKLKQKNLKGFFE
ncbi:MAG: hypothetical protein ACP5N1_06410 [Candidatus Woesearchaeota archaeon]